VTVLTVTEVKLAGATPYSTTLRYSTPLSARAVAQLTVFA
jgi:hypothetical protein